MSYSVKLDTFEGPLDLLLYLIRKNEMPIEDIEIAKITGQYLDFINAMRVLDVDLASEFVVMAATLIYIKSKMMLPKPELENTDEEVDPREELIRRLLEYQQFKQAASELEKKPYLNEDIFKVYRPLDPIEVDFDPKTGLVEVGMYELALAFQDVLNRTKTSVHEVEAEEYSLEDKIIEVVAILKASTDERVEFKTLFSKSAAKGEVVVTFLSILELSKLGYFKLFQAGHRSDIYLKTVKSFEDFQMGEISVVMPLNIGEA
jgi:segregation and condensation protein A